MAHDANHAVDDAALTLERRPEATTPSIERLLHDVDTGRIRIPTWQRPLQWDANDIKLLLDSIYRGYPVGTLLFWKRAAEAQAIVLGPRRLNVPTRQDALWVVDGQQRITALVGVLTGDYEDPKDKFSLFFDLASKFFVRAGKRMQPEITWLPLNRIADSEHLLQWLFENQSHLDLEQRTAAIRLGKRVREYQLPAYVVESDDESLLRDIFDRTNSSGKPLQAHDVFDALHGKVSATPQGIKAIAGTLQETGFGDIGAKLVYKALLAILGKDPTVRVRKVLEQRHPQDVFARTQRALQRVIVFVQQQGIPNIALVPYKVPLATLARFFDLHPEPSQRSRTLLARWLWRGAVSESHVGNTAAIRRLLDAIDDDEAGSVDALLREVGSQPTLKRPLGPVVFRNARSKLMALALWKLQPRHLLTREPLRIEDLMAHGPPLHKIRELRKDDTGRRLSLANRLLHPPLAGGLVKAISAQRDLSILESHGLTIEALDALRQNNFSDFLAIREAYLIDHVHSFLVRRTQWRASDRPAIASLIVPDED